MYPILLIAPLYWAGHVHSMPQVVMPSVRSLRGMLRLVAGRPMGLEQAQAKGKPGVHLFNTVRRQLTDEVLGQILVESAQLVEKDSRG